MSLRWHEVARYPVAAPVAAIAGRAEVVVSTAVRKRSNKRRRTEHVGVRFTPQEKQTVREYVTAAGFVSEAAFLRHAALWGRGVPAA